jgi:hypothetical protein
MPLSGTTTVTTSGNAVAFSSGDATFPRALAWSVSGRPKRKRISVFRKIGGMP